MFSSPNPHSCCHTCTLLSQSMDPYCKPLGVRLPYLVHSSHRGSVPQLHALFWHHLHFSPHVTKQPCPQLQRNALISVSGEAALHFCIGGLASLNNLPRNEYFPMKYFSSTTSCSWDLDQFRKSLKHWQRFSSQHRWGRGHRRAAMLSYLLTQDSQHRNPATCKILKEQKVLAVAVAIRS